MKKTLIIALSLIVVLSAFLVSCGKSDNENSKTDTSKETEVSKADTSKPAEESKEIVIDKEALYANADNTEFKAGDTVTIKAGFNDERSDAAIGVDYEYDDTVLELTAIEWLLKDALISDSTLGEVAVIAYDEKTPIKGDIIEFKFKVKENVSASNTNVKIIAILEEDLNNIEYEANVKIDIKNN